MAIGLLGLMGLGAGATMLQDQYRQGQQGDRAGLMGSALFGDPMEQFGPMRPGEQRQTFMEGGLLGNASTPEQAAAYRKLMLADPQLAQQYASSMLIPQQQGVKPTSLEQNLALTGLVPGTPEYQAAAREAILKPSTRVTVAMNKPLNAEQLLKFRHPVSGETAMPGDTMDDVAAKGLVPVNAPTAEEAKQSAQAKTSAQMLDRLAVLAKHPEFDYGAGAAAKAQALAGGSSLWAQGVRAVTEFLSGEELSKRDAEVLSLQQALENSLVAALRGAQVGPQEIERFVLQLPQWGQNKDLFWSNVEQTRKNLAEMERIKTQMRRPGMATTTPYAATPGLLGATPVPPPPPGVEFVE